MSSFIYFYSKFTEEFLLLGGAGIFTLLSAYCYHWVIKRRRLGAARSQVPAGVVKAYLEQLINEAKFVRTQLFGILGGDASPDAAKFDQLFAGLAGGAGVATGTPQTGEAAITPALSGSVPSDLLERLKALEAQLAQKESLVVNINVEKTKLLEELENLKQNQKAIASAATAGNSDDLLKKIKNLEERLEEYALFEDDLANLKRLQQENTTLKKRLEEGAASAPLKAVEPMIETAPQPSAPAPMEAEPVIDVAAKDAKSVSLDQTTIDSMLNGVSPVPPQSTKPTEPAVQAAAPAVAAAPAADNFEKLVDSVESSLNKAEPAPAAAPQPAAQTAAPAAPATSVADKTDEELLKEFESLLNS